MLAGGPVFEAVVELIECVVERIWFREALGAFLLVSQNMFVTRSK